MMCTFQLHHIIADIQIRFSKLIKKKRWSSKKSLIYYYYDMHLQLLAKFHRVLHVCIIETCRLARLELKVTQIFITWSTQQLSLIDPSVWVPQVYMHTVIEILHIKYFNSIAVHRCPDH